MIYPRVSIISTISLLEILHDPENVRPQLQFLISTESTNKMFEEVLHNNTFPNLFVHKIGSVKWHTKGNYKYLEYHYSNIIFKMNNAKVRYLNPIMAIKKIPRKILEDLSAEDGLLRLSIFPALYAILSLELISKDIDSIQIHKVKNYYDGIIKEALENIKKLIFIDAKKIQQLPYSDKLLLKFNTKSEISSNEVNVSGNYKELEINLSQDANKKFVRKIIFASYLPQAHNFMIQNSDIFFFNHHNNLNQEQFVEFIRLRFSAYEPNYYNGLDSIRLLPSKYQRDIYYKIERKLDYRAKENLDYRIYKILADEHKKEVIYLRTFDDTISSKIISNVKSHYIIPSDAKLLTDEKDQLLFTLFCLAYYIDIKIKEKKLRYGIIGARTRYGILELYRKFVKRKKFTIKSLGWNLPSNIPNRWFNEQDFYENLVRKGFIKIIEEKLSNRNTNVYYINTNDPIIFQIVVKIIDELFEKI